MSQNIPTPADERDNETMQLTGAKERYMRWFALQKCFGSYEAGELLSIVDAQRAEIERQGQALKDAEAKVERAQTLLGAFKKWMDEPAGGLMNGISLGEHGIKSWRFGDGSACHGYLKAAFDVLGVKI